MIEEICRNCKQWKESKYRMNLGFCLIYPIEKIEKEMSYSGFAGNHTCRKWEMRR